MGMKNDPIFFSESFVILALTLGHFELIFVYGVR